MNETQTRNQQDDLNAHYEEMDDVGRERLVHFARFLMTQSSRRRSEKKITTAKIIPLGARLASRGRA